MAQPSTDIDVAIEELEGRLERLRALYEQYFIGIEKIEPSVPRQDVDRRIYALRKVQIRNTAKRFKLQTIIQRYNAFQQYWLRTCREIENGTYHRHVARAQSRFGDVPLTVAGRRKARRKAESEEQRAMAEQKERVMRASEDDLEALLSEDPEAALSEALEVTDEMTMPAADTFALKDEAFEIDWEVEDTLVEAQPPAAVLAADAARIAAERVKAAPGEVPRRAPAGPPKPPPRARLDSTAEEPTRRGAGMPPKEAASAAPSERPEAVTAKAESLAASTQREAGAPEGNKPRRRSERPKTARPQQPGSVAPKPRAPGTSAAPAAAANSAVEANRGAAAKPGKDRDMVARAAAAKPDTSAKPTETKEAAAAKPPKAKSVAPQESAAKAPPAKAAPKPPEFEIAAAPPAQAQDGSSKPAAARAKAQPTRADSWAALRVPPMAPKAANPGAGAEPPPVPQAAAKANPTSAGADAPRAAAVAKPAAPAAAAAPSPAAPADLARAVAPKAAAAVIEGSPRPAQRKDKAASTAPAVAAAALTSADAAPRAKPVVAAPGASAEPRPVPAAAKSGAVEREARPELSADGSKAEEARAAAANARAAATRAAEVRAAGAAARSTLDDARVGQLYGTLVAERRRLQQPGKVSVDALASSLRETEKKLRTQYADKNIDFHVVVKDGKAMVKPIIG